MTRAVVKKLVTSDGICATGDHVKIGDVYMVEMSTLENLTWDNTENPGIVVRPSVIAHASATGAGGYLPIELFDVDGWIEGVDD